MVKKSNNPLIASLSGSIAGCLEATATWPTEYTKTLLQLQNKNNKYKGIIDCAKQQVQKNGILGLYRGLGSALIFAFPKAGIRFGTFSFVKNNIEIYSNNTIINNLTAGTLAGAVEAMLVVTPQETIKTKLIKMNKKLLPGIKHILKHEGYSGIYNGLFPTIIKQSSNQGIRFMMYGIYKNLITNGNPEYKFSPLEALGGGMFSGTCSVLINNPIDVIKTRMQGGVKYKNTLDCIKQLITKEGFIAFYKGVGSRLMRVIPGQGIIFVSYETISDIITNLISKDL